MMKDRDKTEQNGTIDRRQRGIMMGKTLKNALLMLILASAMILTGCGSKADNAVNGNADASGSSSYTFTDALGRIVTVNSHERVASLLGSFSDVWLTAGGSLVAAADETWDNVDEQLPDSVIKLGGIQNINVELLIAAKPDFVIASAYTDAHVALKDVLENAGICVAYFYVTTFEDYLDMLKICTDITGRTELYQQNGVQVAEQIDRIKRERITTEQPRILFLRAASTNVKAKASEDTVGTQILKDLNCVNIADSDSALKDNLSVEAIVKAEPDYIFVTTQGSKTQAAMDNVDKLFKSNPVWSSLTAVKNNRYYVLDKKLFNNKPNKRWGEAYQQIADILYPVK